LNQLRMQNRRTVRTVLNHAPPRSAPSALLRAQLGSVATGRHAR
jgi:hypothetical protein